MVAVGDQGEVEVVGQVAVGVTAGGGGVGADPWVGDDGCLGGLQDQAGVVEVADPGAGVDVAVGGKAGFGGQQRPQRGCLALVRGRAGRAAGSWWWGGCGSRTVLPGRGG